MITPELWSPETNLIQTGLLTEARLTAMKAAKHGYEVWHIDGYWLDYPGNGHFYSGTVYRALPAAVAHAKRMTGGV